MRAFNLTLSGLDLALIILFSVCIIVIYQFVWKHAHFRNNNLTLALKASVAIALVVSQILVIHSQKKWGDKSAV